MNKESQKLLISAWLAEQEEYMGLVTPERWNSLETVITAVVSIACYGIKQQGLELSMRLLKPYIKYNEATLSNLKAVPTEELADKSIVDKFVNLSPLDRALGYTQVRINAHTVSKAIRVILEQEKLAFITEPTKVSEIGEVGEVGATYRKKTPPKI